MSDSDDVPITLENVRVMMETLDSSGDGDLDFDEFCHAFEGLISDKKVRHTIAL